MFLADFAFHVFTFMKKGETKMWTVAGMYVARMWNTLLTNWWTKVCAFWASWIDLSWVLCFQWNNSCNLADYFSTFFPNDNLVCEKIWRHFSNDMQGWRVYKYTDILEECSAFCIKTPEHINWNLYFKRNNLRFLRTIHFWRRLDVLLGHSMCQAKVFNNQRQLMNKYVLFPLE